MIFSITNVFAIDNHCLRNFSTVSFIQMVKVTYE